jgi:hypothetical protein
MNKITITQATLERLKGHSLDGGIGFDEPGDDGLVEIDVSDAVLDRVNDKWPGDDGVQSDEDFDAAINLLLDEVDDKAKTRH